MKTVYLSEPPSAPTRHEVLDVRDFLASSYERFPETARIYHASVDQAHDVTPTEEAGIEKLGELPGPFYVIVWPGTAVEYIVRGFAAVMTFGTSELIIRGVPALVRSMLPTMPAALGNVQSSSPNNDPFNRQNQGRPLARIPDIFGTVRAVPDLLCVPYKRFTSAATEVEHSFFCLGRGSYAVSNIRDGSTLVSQVPGASLQVFGPNTSPNSGAPQLQIGAAIVEPFLSAKRSPSVDGVTLLPGNARIVGNNNLRFYKDGTIEATPDSGIHFSEIVALEATLVLTGVNAPKADFSGNVNLDGGYYVAAVSDSTVTLLSPSSANANWGLLPNPGVNDARMWSTGAPTLDSIQIWTVGPYFCDFVGATQLLVNLVAPGGAYKIDTAGKQTAASVAATIQVAPSVDGVTPSGAWVSTTVTIYGSATDKLPRGATLQIPVSGPCLVQAVRYTGADVTFAGTIVDEIKWRELYEMAPITASDFGDVTTIRMAMPRTRSAIYDHERRLNLLATRKVLQRGAGALVASTRADDIFTHICLDPWIGRRSLSDVDIAGIYASVADVVSYFGTSVAADWNATLDKDVMSFEETAAAIASAIHCTAYRRGSQLRLKFEKATTDSVLLWNHRNKLPGSETRTFVFGTRDTNDGVEYQFTDSAHDDEIATLYLPADRSAQNPTRVESVGIRNRLQAYFLANRLWNRIRYQAIATEFDGLQEAEILVRNDRMLVADNTRLDVHQGQVVGEDGLVLTLSQIVTLAAGKSYTIFLQLSDGTIDSIGVTGASSSAADLAADMAVTLGGDFDQVQLARPARLPLSTDASNYAQATYWIVANDDPREQAFLLLEKLPKDKLTFTLRAVNYDARYYQADQDFALGVVDGEGYPT